MRQQKNVSIVTKTSTYIYIKVIKKNVPSQTLLIKKSKSLFYTSSLRPHRNDTLLIEEYTIKFWWIKSDIFFLHNRRTSK